MAPKRTKNSVIGRAHRLGLVHPGNGKAAKAVTIRALRPAVIKAVPAAKPLLTLVPTEPKGRKRNVELPPSTDSAFSRPWEARGPGECAWPLSGEGGTWSCCAPTEGVYCKAHRKIMFIPSRPFKQVPAFARR